MRGKRWLCLYGLAWGLCGLASVVSSGAPWDKLLTTNRIEADPAKPYALTEKNGPWMIMAASFSGEKAREQAHDLAIELRKRYKLPAYVFEKKFDLKEDELGRRLDARGREVRMVYKRGHGEVDEIAVLVGNYPAADDLEAQDTLRKIKYFRPDCLDLTKQASSRSLAGWRLLVQSWLPDESTNKKKGPMGHAFVTTNPTLPPDYYTPKGLDKLLVNANTGVTHSLLDCPGKYTLQVAHFTGHAVIKKVADMAGSRMGEEPESAENSALVTATKQAHELTESLRMKGYEAYEFHDYCASIVTVGSFSSVGEKRPDGRIELDPTIVRLMEIFKAKPQTMLGNSTPTMIPQTLVGIQLDTQPIVVHVPRRSIGADYARDSSDLR
jgi:hypothetical protein